jgi:hypothetical protein
MLEWLELVAEVLEQVVKDFLVVTEELMSLLIEMLLVVVEQEP